MQIILTKQSRWRGGISTHQEMGYFLFLIYCSQISSKMSKCISIGLPPHTPLGHSGCRSFQTFLDGQFRPGVLQIRIVATDIQRNRGNPLHIPVLHDSTIFSGTFTEENKNSSAGHRYVSRYLTFLKGTFN